MNFDLTDEQQMLQSSLRRFLRDQYIPAPRAGSAQAANSYSPDRWNGLAELGVIGAMFSETDGGLAGSGFDLALVFEELGRVGAIEPLLDTAVLGGGLIASTGNDAQKKLIAEIVAGSLQLAFAHTEPASRYEIALVETTAVRDGSTYVLNGSKAVVVNAPGADHIVVSARTAGSPADRDGISLFCIPAATDGMVLRGYLLVGGGRAAELTLDQVTVGAAALIGTEGDAFDAIALATARAVVAISAEALGLMEAIKTLTADYLKTRKQFGRPIAEFQALQHRMSDMAVEIEQARSAVINLAGHIDGPVELRERHVSATKNLVGNVANLVAEEGIQMHGGIGMTDEYVLGHLAKRLIMVDHRFGDATYHLERFIGLAVA